jgi:hypothetical protein
MTINLNRANLSLDPLNAEINRHIEEAARLKLAMQHAQAPRGYLGASIIGDDCLRKVQFDWMATATLPVRTRSIFARGHFFEAETRQQLIDVGFVFAPPEALKFTAVDGLLAGHADGIIINAPIASLVTPALWECKALNAKNFRALERDGFAKSFPRYVAQIALYQSFLNVTNPALVTAVNADTCERLYFTVNFDARRAQEASDRAVSVIEATRAGELLPRLDPYLEDFRCKMCPHLSRCMEHG